MSDIPPINNASFGSLSTGTQSTQDQGSGQEFNDWLQLLTTQIRNQDPLEPLDSTQFVEQLASFSTLEQQVESNQSLDRISTLIGDLNALAAEEWLGEEIVIESSWLPFQGETVEYEISPPPQADAAFFTVVDSDGNVVLNEPLNMSTTRHQWNGELLGDQQATIDSLYQVSVDYYQAGTYLGSAAPRLVTTVTDVATENGKVKLGTAMNLSADAEDVRSAK